MAENNEWFDYLTWATMILLFGFMCYQQGQREGQEQFLESIQLTEQAQANTLQCYDLLININEE